MISERLRQEVTWSGPCAYCGDFAPTQVDHITPRSRGGTDDRSNLTPACRLCNMEKGDFTPAEYREYREEKGLGWPPKSRGQLITETIHELMDRHGYTRDDLSRMCNRMAARRVAGINQAATSQPAATGQAG